MTTVFHEAVPLTHMPKSVALHHNLGQELNGCAAFATEIVALSCLGVSCTASSIVFLFSLGISMPIFTEQVGTWLTSGQWNSMPLLVTLTRMGFETQFDGAVLGPVADWILSRETGLLLVVTASVFGCTVWLFEIARSRLITRSGN